MNQILTVDTISIKLVGLANLSSQLFANSINDRFNSACSTVTIAQANQLPPERNNQILIIDCNQIESNEIFKLIHHHTYKNSKVKFILLNTNSENSQITWVRWPVVYGYIPDTLDYERVLLAIEQIIAGELWLPRNVLNQFFKKNRRIPATESSQIDDLTRRELEILNMAAEGFTNPEIADRLSVSINTIKSHLHNLFKKLSVKNRVQAIDWIKSHDTY